MADGTYLLLLVGVFAIFVLLVRACDRIVRSGDDGSAGGTDIAGDAVNAAAADR